MTAFDAGHQSAATGLPPAPGDGHSVGPGVVRASQPLLSESLRVDSVSKAYGQVQALDRVSLTVSHGEVVGLVGDNGAGKSTLVKVISGVIEPDEGSIYVEGSLVSIRAPHDAARFGIRTIFQDLALAGNLSVVDNLFLGRELTRRPVLLRQADFRGMRRMTVEALDGLGIGTIDDVDVPVERLSGGQRQTVAVARAMLTNCATLLLDEPTASLGLREARSVMDLVRRLRDQGTGILIITHNMRQVFEVADRIVVLHVGRVRASFRTSETTPEVVVKAIMGKAGNEAVG
jgi:ABC-type sugar transport system ATPase subunit